MINDNQWHYFVDENGDVVAAINSGGTKFRRSSMVGSARQ